MNKFTIEACTEVDAILELMDEKYVEQVPLKLRELFKENKSKEYIKVIRVDCPLEEQSLKEETLNILAVLYDHYWCKDEEKKKQLLKQYVENEKEYQEKLKKENKFDSVFKNNGQQEPKITETINNEISIVECKKSIFEKIKDGLKKIFKNKNTKK